MAPGEPPKPPVEPGAGRGVSLEAARRAIEAAKAVLSYAALLPLPRREPRGLCVDLVIMYQGVAIDRVHFNPETMAPSPKGAPACTPAGREEEVLEAADRAAEKLLEELRVLEAAEYREPEDAWVVPVAWREFIVAHIRVTSRGEIKPDHALTREALHRLAPA